MRKVPTIEQWLEAIKSCLNDDLLKPRYRKVVKKLRESNPNLHPVTGHCYLATEAAYHLFGKDNGYKPTCYKFENGTTHWWLSHDQLSLIDPTVEQTDGNFPYKKGRRQNFMPGSPQKTCRDLMKCARLKLIPLIP